MSEGGRAEPGPRRLSLERLSTVVQTVAIVLAGGWGVYTFIYEARIAPSLAPPTVSVTSALARVGQRDGLVAIRSTVTRTNVGQTGVRVLGLTYNIIGVRTHFGPATGERMPDRFPQSGSVSQARYYEESGPGEVILRQGLLFEGATDQPAGRSELNPGESVSRDLIFFADPSQFDSVRFVVSFSYAKLSEPGLPLVLEVGSNGQLQAVPAAACRTEAARCKGLTTTDFGTEFSLW